LVPTSINQSINQLIADLWPEGRIANELHVHSMTLNDRNAPPYAI